MTKPAALTALTGLRFFAALAVLLFHVSSTLTLSVGQTILPYGYLGVNFFFVLSGYILCHVYSQQTFTPLAFYRKRAARILPLHYLTLIVWCYLFYATWGNSPQEKYNSLVANLLLLQSWFSGFVYNLGYNAVSWSISVEAFFYLLFPFILIKSRSVVLLVLSVVTMLCLSAGTVQHIETIFPNFFAYNPAARLMEFVAGIALYKAFATTRCTFSLASVLQVLSIPAVWLVARYVAPQSGNWLNVLMLAPFCLMIYAFSQSGILEKVLSRKLFVVLGDASFALYMIHHLYFKALDPRLAAHFTQITALTLAVMSVIVLSVVTHYGFEKPMQRFLLKGPLRERSKVLVQVET